MKLAFFDVETGGLDADMHALLELYMTVEVDGHTIGNFYAAMRPDTGKLVEEEAVLANKLWDKSISFTEFRRSLDENRENSFSAYQRFQVFLKQLVNKWDKQDKLFLLGYNSAAFDDKFLREFVRYHEPTNKFAYGSFFHWPTGDVAILAQFALGDEWAKLTSRKLADVARRFGVGVQEEQLHGAKYDTMVTRDLYYAVVKMIQEKKT